MNSFYVGHPFQDIEKIIDVASIKNRYGINNIVTHNNDKTSAIMIDKLIKYLEETDNYPIESKKE